MAGDDIAGTVLTGPPPDGASGAPPAPVASEPGLAEPALIVLGAEPVKEPALGTTASPPGAGNQLREGADPPGTVFMDVQVQVGQVLGSYQLEALLGLSLIHI